MFLGTEASSSSPIISHHLPSKTPLFATHPLGTCLPEGLPQSWDEAKQVSWGTVRLEKDLFSMAPAKEQRLSMCFQPTRVEKPQHPKGWAEYRSMNFRGLVSITSQTRRLNYIIIVSCFFSLLIGSIRVKKMFSTKHWISICTGVPRVLTGPMLICPEASRRIPLPVLKIPWSPGRRPWYQGFHQLWWGPVPAKTFDGLHQLAWAALCTCIVDVS